MDETINYALFLAKHLDKDDAKSAVIAMLVGLDLPPYYDGFQYLANAILSDYRNPMQSLTKEVYPKAGMICDPPVTAAQVEKSIRYAIKKAWQSRNIQKWERIFPGMKKKPTNGMFISQIARVLDLWQHCYKEADTNERTEYSDPAIYRAVGQDAAR